MSTLILLNVIRGAVFEQRLVHWQLPSLEVRVVDTPQRYNSRCIQVDPLNMLFSDKDLFTAGGNDAPAEILFCVKSSQPAEILGQHGHQFLKHRVQWTTGDELFPLQGLEIWDHLLLNHCQN